MILKEGNAYTLGGI